jgi:hypothetical protein
VIAAAGRMREQAETLLAIIDDPRTRERAIHSWDKDDDIRPQLRAVP